MAYGVHVVSTRMTVKALVPQSMIFISRTATEIMCKARVQRSRYLMQECMREEGLTMPPIPEGLPCPCCCMLHRKTCTNQYTSLQVSCKLPVSLKGLLRPPLSETWWP